MRIRRRPQPTPPPPDLHPPTPLLHAHPHAAAPTSRLGQGRREGTAREGSLWLHPSPPWGHAKKEEELDRPEEEAARASLVQLLMGKQEEVGGAHKAENIGGVHSTAGSSRAKVEAEEEEEEDGGGEDDGDEKKPALANGDGGRKRRRKPAVLMEGSRCSRVNGRGWRCCQQTLVGYSLCEHHLGKGRLRSMNSVRCNGGGRKKGDRSILRDDDDDDDDHLPRSRQGKRKIGIVKARSISSLLHQTGQLKMPNGEPPPAATLACAAADGIGATV